MGRKSTHPAREYFEIDDEKRESECKVSLCKFIMKGGSYNHAGNMESHLFTKHKELRVEIEMKKELVSEQAEAKRKNELPKEASSSVPALKKIRIEMDIQYLKKSCVELCTTNGRAFKLMDDSGFRRIIEPILVALPDKEAISAESIREEVILSAEDYRKSLRKEIEGKLVCIKLDCCTRLDRSILGINCQFINDRGQICLRTLSMREIFVRHTSVNLKDIVYDVLRKFEIPLCNIYTLTTDSGANVLKISKLISADQKKIQKEQERNMIEDPDENGLDSIGRDDAVSDSVLAAIEMPDNTIQGIRCAAHNLQLAIMDCLNDRHIKDIISRFRGVAKKLRNQNLMMIIRALRLPLPLLDCVTR